MARPILFSQVFPSYHPKAGKPTFFVEKIWKLLEEKHGSDFLGTMPEKLVLHPHETSETLFAKSHTIRAGYRWKENEYFSPRVWSGPPYRSRQIIIAKDLLIRNIWTIQILPTTEIFIQGQPYGFYGSPDMEKLALHDGLTPEDFQAWFSRLPFEGQIICWDPDLQY